MYAGNRFECTNRMADTGTVASHMEESVMPDEGCASAGFCDERLCHSGRSQRSPVPRAARHRRNYSDPVATSRSPLLLGPKGSVVDVRDGGVHLEDGWQEVKQHFMDARLKDREISRDIERENMHLYLSEMLISAIEQLKWRNEAKETDADPHAESASTRSDTGSGANSEGSSSTLDEGTCAEMKAGCSTFYATVDDLDSLPFCRRDEETSGDGDDESGGESSAEAIASSLLKHFSSMRPPELADDIKWLVSFAHAPQMLLPMPSDIAVYASELQVDGRPIRIRGSFDWAPPRKQWIFTLHPHISGGASLLEEQNFRCAGCGVKVGKLYAHRMRFCDYYGRMFCPRCHQGAKMRIPARIIQQWNFREFPVSDMARRFLLDNHSQPVINILAVEPRFYDRFRHLRHIRVLRLKLVHLWSFIRQCSLAEDTVTKHGNLRTMFTSVPGHLLCDADVFSMADLENVENGDFTRLVEPLVQFGRYHVESCEQCSSQAFLCELCGKEELLFPFQLEKVDRCGECGSISHTKCAAKRRKEKRRCPKCIRIALNRERHRHQSTNSLSAFKSSSSSSSSSS